MELQLLLSFLFASFGLTVMPGPDNLYVLSESITKGAKQGVWLSVGLGSGVLIHTLAAATGLSIILTTSDLAYHAISIAGAGYLFYLAYLSFGEKPLPLDPNNPNKLKKSPFKLWRKGFTMNVLNPKVSLFFLAFLPQFVSEEGWPAIGQLSVYGLLFMAQAILIFSGIAVLAGQLRSLINNQNFWKVTKWIKVLFLGFLGLGLIWSAWQ